MGDRATKDVEPDVTAASKRPRPTRTAASSEFSLQEQIGNRAISQVATLLLQPNASTTQATAAPVEIVIDPERPWLYEIRSGSPADAARELYGADLSQWEAAEQVFVFSTYTFAPRRRLMIEFLRDPWRASFYQAMDALFEQDVRKLEALLLDGGGSDARAYLTFWANRRDLRRQSGESYFDALLQRLKDDKWYTDYFLWESKRHPFLDLLYSVGGAADVHAIIGANSERFGYYRPPFMQGAIGFVQSAAPVDPAFVSRASDMITDRLVGRTSGRDSRDIVRLLAPLPANVQVEVLRHFMARYGTNETTLWIFSRSGEPTEAHMLYWLFEDLDGDDRQKLADAFRASGIMTEDALASLVEGRTWAGRNLPWSTYHGQKATEFWAEKYTQGHSWAAIPGVFSSLWLPETAGSTVLTLAGARLFPAVGEMSPMAGKVLLVGGTGLTAFQTTIAAQEAITGRSAWTDEPLPFENRIGRILESVSGALLLGAGFLGAARLSPGTSLARAGPAVPEVQPPPRGTPSPVEGRILSADPTSGDFTVLLRHAGTGEILMVRGNVNTGNGVVTNMTYGVDVAVIRGGVLSPLAPGGALPGPIGQPGATVAPFEPVSGGGIWTPIQPASLGPPGAPLALPGPSPTPPIPLPAPLLRPAWLQGLPEYMQQDLLRNPPAMDPARTARLQEAIRGYRRLQIVPRRLDEPGSVGVPVAGGTVAAAETDIGVLEGRIFPGASREALPPNLRGTAGTTGGDIFRPVNPTAVDHAEHVALENVRMAIDQALEVPGVSRNALLAGRTVFLAVEQEPCPSCAAGVAGGAPGVIEQFSLRYPELTIEVRNMRTSRSYIYRNGRLLNP